MAWSISTDGGNTWHLYHLIQSTTESGNFATDGGRVNDLTAYLAGQTNFLLKADLYSAEWTWRMNEQIFRTNSGAEWGLDMKVSLVPEPASLALLALGGLVILRRRLK